MQSDDRLEDVNTAAYVDSFVAAATEAYSHTQPTGHLMLNFGQDFQYENADYYFRNLDRLIDAVNADGRVKGSVLHVACSVVFSNRADDCGNVMPPQCSIQQRRSTSMPCFNRV